MHNKFQLKSAFLTGEYLEKTEEKLFFSLKRVKNNF